MAQGFVHLHLHTQYSLLDGANKISEIVSRAQGLGFPAVAMTDHGNLHGALEFYYAAKKVGIKPLIGCELYVTSGSRFDKRPKSQGGAGTYHLTVLAQDKVGYKNLIRLVSLAYKEGFYFKPRVDHELLEQCNEGLIVLSGCLNGELAEAALADDEREARNRIEWHATTFKDRFYLEVQPHAVPEQRKLNQLCAEMGKSVGLPIVASNDCHYPLEGDHFAQEVLMCISTGKLVTDPERLQHVGVNLHLKTEQEIRAGLGEWRFADEACQSTLAIADRCNLSLDSNQYYMPSFKADPHSTEDPTPEELNERMAVLAREGLERRLVTVRGRAAHWSAADEGKYRDRLEEEIRLIWKMGFSGYFLVVSDFIVWAKEHGVPVGPGRGSAAGSLVAYAMRITDVDPLEHKLLFERFLNPERVSLPDIDVDFCINGRDRVIEYVVQRYGSDRVAQIATFGTLKAKAAIKDVGRALGLSYAETDRVAQLVPAPRQGFEYPLEEALKMEPRLSEYAKGEGKQLIELACRLEGLTRHSSTHAAGVVIGDRPLIELLPMMVDKDGKDVTQFSMTYVEKAGLVKFDFLGLKTLTVIHTALRIIGESRGVQVDFDLIPLGDPKTYAMLSSGNTTGVFQLESSGITDMTVRLKPNSFDDLVAILALYRPGPLDAGMVDHYIARKHGREPVTYLHPLMKHVLSDTYGIMLYQEQIMQLARELAGYSLGEADLLRKAMGKKIPEEMAKQRERFIEGAVGRGVPRPAAKEIFDQMETFARYGFNRSHSAAYAMISFQTAYLKAHYPVEFMAALMSHEMEDSDKTLKNLNECRTQKIRVLPPDVNLSIAGFSVHQGRIRYGLEAVKGIGEKAVQCIVEARTEGGPFKDLEDFLLRVDLKAVNRRVMESLIKCGAFDFSGETRRDQLSRLEDSLKAAQSLSKERDTTQMSLFGGAEAAPSIPKRATKLPEWPVNQKLAFEREALGFYISGHPLEKFLPDLKRFGAITTQDLKARAPSPAPSRGPGARSAEVRIAGVVTALKLKNTKKGDRYATFTLEDWLGTIEAIVWPDVYRQIASVIVADDPVLIVGKADISEERKTLIVDKMESLIALRDKNATIGVLRLTAEDLDREMAALQTLFRRHQGTCPVKVQLSLGEAQVRINLKDQRDAPVCVVPSEALCDEIEQIFGRPVLSFQ